jgi:hypothetical protein
MTPKSALSLSRQIQSDWSIWGLSLFAGLSVFSIAVLLQWLIYDDWMHDSGPVRLVGSFLAFVLTVLFSVRWQRTKRQQKIEVIRRVETIKWMNDRIRNSLQAIECLVYASNPHVTDPVRDSVDAIEDVLKEILSDLPLGVATPVPPAAESSTVKPAV